MRPRVMWWVAAAFLVAGCSGTAAPVTPAPSSTQATTASPTATADANQDPARFAAQVKARAAEAGVAPQLVMAILYNESYKPHDPNLERAWQKIKPDAAFGVANMHQATFDETKQGTPFAGRDWQELPDDPDLAIRAEAWYLHDLAAQLPAHHSGGYSADELLAVGYNAGPATMKTVARGGKAGAQVQSYVDTLRTNWQKAADALAR